MMSAAGAAVTIGIVIPHYRDAARFRDQLAALKNQTRPCDVIMVVDDASPDSDFAALTDILKDHPDVVLVRRSNNGGPAEACNDGLERITTDCVAFVATDDILHPDFVAETAAMLEQYPEAAFAFADPSVLQEGEREAVTFPLCLSAKPIYFSAPQIEAILRMTYLTFATNTILYRVDAVKRGGSTPVALKSFGDTYLNFVLGLRQGACYIPRALGTYVWRSKSYAGQLVRNRAEMRSMTDAMLEVLRERHADCYERFRVIGILPAHNMRVLGYLLRTAQGRRYLTVKMAVMCVALGVWHDVRLLLPAGFRRFMRQVASRLAKNEIGLR